MAEKKPKPIIRKCHNCGKVLDEDKDFCLHCGETYREVVKEKKKMSKAQIKKLLIISGIALAACLIIALTTFLIYRYVTQSRYFRVVNYINEMGESEAIEIVDRETENLIEVEAKMAEMDENTYLYCFEGDETRFYIHRYFIAQEYNENGKVTGEFKIDLDICLDEQTPRAYTWNAILVYDAKDGYQGYDFKRFYKGALDPYDFTYTEGTLEAEKLADEDFVNPFENAKALYAELENVFIRMKLEDIIDSMHGATYELKEDSQITPLLKDAMDELELLLKDEDIEEDEELKLEADKILDDFNTAYYALFPPQVEEEEGAEDDGAEVLSMIIALGADKSSDKNEDSSASDDGESPLPPSESILRAAMDAISEQACFALKSLEDFLPEANIKATVGELGYVKYQEYLDSLITIKR